VRLVGFTIEIYYDGQSYKRQICGVVFRALRTTLKPIEVLSST